MEERVREQPPPEPEPKREEGEKPGFFKRKPVIVLGSLLMAVLFFFGLRYLVTSFTHESTDDAFLDADVVGLAPQVAGRVRRVLVVENQRVRAGELLLEIDPRDFEVQAKQKQAALASAQANVNLLLASVEYLGSQVETATATARQSAAEASSLQALAERAAADYQRSRDLMARHVISQREFDAAKSAADSTAADLKAAREKRAGNEAKVTGARAQVEAARRALERGQAQVRQAEMDVQAAKLNLDYTRITAPQDGRITKKSVADGDYVQVGQRLMAIVPHTLWVTANFKETQLKNIRPSQPARIRIDSVAGRVFAGHVQSIQAGSGSWFSLLPPENAVGNFVKVVQRVPVRILFDDPLNTPHVLGPGMSVAPSVRISNFEMPEWVMLGIALGAALALGLVWWLLARRGENGASAREAHG